MTASWLKSGVLAVYVLGCNGSVRADEPVRDDRLPSGATARIGSTRWLHPPVKCSGIFFTYLPFQFSADGKKLASATADGQVHVWEVPSGRQLLRIDAPKDAEKDLEWPYCTGLGLTDDGRHLGLLIHNQGVKIFDAESGKELGAIADPSEKKARPGIPREGFFTFSPDNAHLAMTTDNPEDNDIYLCEIASRKLIRKFEGHEHPVRCAAFSADGKTLASCGDDLTVRLWDVESGKLRHTFKGHRSLVASVAISPDGKKAASLGYDDTIRIWDTESGAGIKAELQIDRSGELARSGAGSKTNTTLRFSTDGKTLAASLPMGIYSWDVASGKVQREPKESPADPFHQTIMSADGKYIARWHVETGRITLYDATTDKKLTPEVVVGSNFSLAVSPDGNLLATAGDGEAIQLWDVHSRREVRRLPTSWVTFLYFSSDSKTLYAHVGYRPISAWDVTSGKELPPIRARGDMITQPGGSPDGRCIAFVTSGETNSFGRKTNPPMLHFFDTVQRQERLIKPPVPGLLRAATNGKWIFMSAQDGAYFADVSDLSKEPRPIKIPASWPSNVQFAPNGAWLVTAEDNGDVRVLDIGTGWEVRQLGEKLDRKPPDPTLGEILRMGPAPVTISPDSRTVASEGNNNSIVVSEVASGKIRRVFEHGHQGIITALGYTPDGKTLISTDKLGMIVFWDATQAAKSKEPQAEHLEARQLESLWSDLQSDDAVKAFTAISALRAHPKECLPFLEEHLKAVAAKDRDKIQTLVAEALGQDADKADKARQELEKLGDLAEPALRRALDDKKGSDESRKRVEALLRRLTATSLNGDALRNLRAIEVLEQIGTSKARGILDKLAAGAAEARLTREAKGALARIGDPSKGSSESPKGSSKDGGDKPTEEPLPPRARLAIGSGKLLHSSSVNSLGFTSDSQRVISIGSDGFVRLWDVTTGREVLHIDPREVVSFDKGADVLAFDVSRNGKVLGVVVRGKGVLLYDAATGKYRRRIEAGAVTTLAISPDESLLAAVQGTSPREPTNGSTDDRTIRLYDIATGKEVSALSGHENAVHCLTFSRDGKLLLSGSEDLTVRLWDVERAKVIHTCEGPHARLLAVALSADGKLAAGLDLEYSVYVWRTDNGEMCCHGGIAKLSRGTSFSIFGYTNFATTKALKFSEDGKRLYGNTVDGVCEWDVATGNVLYQPKFTGQLQFAVVSPDDKWIARTWDVYQGTGRIELLETASRKQIFPAEVTSCTSMTVSPDGKYVTCGSDDTIIRMWDTSTGKLVRKYEGHTGPVAHLYFTADGKSLISASNFYIDRVVSRWDVATAKEEHVLQMDMEARRGMLLSGDAHTLAWSQIIYGRKNQTSLNVFDLDNGKKVREISTGVHPAKALALSPDGQSYVMQKQDDGSFFLAAIAGETEPRILHPSLRALPMFSADGKTVALAADDGSVRLINPATGHTIRELGEKKEFPRDPDRPRRPSEPFDAPLVAFSADGRMLATAVKDHPIIVWELATGKRRLTLSGANQPKVIGLAFTPDSKTLISASSDGQIIFWDVAGLTAEEKQRAAKLNDKDIEAIWKDLLDDDAVKAYDAIRLLSAANSTLASFQQHLQPAQALDAKKLNDWIADLDSNDFDKRATATTELEKAAGLAEPGLRQSLEGKPTLEASKRIEEILQKLEVRLLRGEELRACRAIEVLEAIHTEQCKQLLEKLAGGAEGALITREAKKALGRNPAALK